MPRVNENVLSEIRQTTAFESGRINSEIFIRIPDHFR